MASEIFSEVKVVDLTWVWAGPMCIKYLADHGTQVIHVESTKRPDLVRTTPPYKDRVPGIDRSAYFANLHNNQLGLSLNLDHAEGRQLLRRLVEWADIVAENFTPGTMKRWGLDYEELKHIKPDIIVISQSQFGQTGPLARQSGTGLQMTALSGFSYFCGWPDRTPSAPYSAYTDITGARLSAAALIAALDYRRRTGKGQYIDVSQYETGVYFLTPALLNYVANKDIGNRMGNRCIGASPHGVYPCKGKDSWCAITVFTDEEWENMCSVMRNHTLADDSKFRTVRERKDNEDELDAIISAWTINLTAQEVMEELQGVGIAAGVVKNAQELYNDPQLKQRRYFWQVEHPVIGKHKFEAEAFELSKTPRRLRMPSPCIGQHNEYVCTKILGMPDEEFVRLLAEGVFD